MVQVDDTDPSRTRDIAGSRYFGPWEQGVVHSKATLWIAGKQLYAGDSQDDWVSRPAVARVTPDSEALEFVTCIEPGSFDPTLESGGQDERVLAAVADDTALYVSLVDSSHRRVRLVKLAF